MEHFIQGEANDIKVVILRKGGRNSPPNKKTYAKQSDIKNKEPKTKCLMFHKFFLSHIKDVIIKNLRVNT